VALAQLLLLVRCVQAVVDLPVVKVQRASVVLVGRAVKGSECLKTRQGKPLRAAAEITEPQPIPAVTALRLETAEALVVLELRLLPLAMAEMVPSQVAVAVAVAAAPMVSIPALAVAVPMDGSESGLGDELRNFRRRRALYQSHPLGW
jgi:hypothetical protein